MDTITQIQVYHISATNTNFFVNCTNNGTGNESSSIKTVRIFVLPKIICKFSFKTHQQNLNFSLYYRGVFFCCGEMKCKQGVKNFEKHPNKIKIFLCIVEGHFSRVNFLFSNLVLLSFLLENVSLIIRKEAWQ